MHSLGCCHRDIKPQNLLLDKNENIKIADFGLGRTYDTSPERVGSEPRTSCGSPFYAAPEVITGEIYDPVKADIWSATVTLFYMTIGILPFQAKNQSLLFQKINNCQYDSIGKIDSLKNANEQHVSKIKETGFGGEIECKEVSIKLKNLFRQVFVREPSKRPNFKRIKNIYWFKIYTDSLNYDKVLLNKCICPSGVINDIDYKSHKNDCPFSNFNVNLNFQLLSQGQQIPQLDDHILKIASHISVLDEYVLREYLLRGQLNKYTTTYELLLKKKFDGNLNLLHSDFPELNLQFYVARRGKINEYSPKQVSIEKTTQGTNKNKFSLKEGEISFRHSTGSQYEELDHLKKDNARAEQELKEIINPITQNTSLASEKNEQKSEKSIFLRNESSKLPQINIIRSKRSHTQSNRPQRTSRTIQESLSPKNINSFHIRPISPTKSELRGRKIHLLLNIDKNNITKARKKIAEDLKLSYRKSRIQHFQFNESQKKAQLQQLASKIKLNKKNKSGFVARKDLQRLKNRTELLLKKLGKSNSMANRKMKYSNSHNQNNMAYSLLQMKGTANDIQNISLRTGMPKFIKKESPDSKFSFFGPVYSSTPQSRSLSLKLNPLPSNLNKFTPLKNKKKSSKTFKRKNVMKINSYFPNIPHIKKHSQFNSKNLPNKKSSGIERTQSYEPLYFKPQLLRKSKSNKIKYLFQKYKSLEQEPPKSTRRSYFQ